MLLIFLILSAIASSLWLPSLILSMRQRLSISKKVEVGQVWYANGQEWIVTDVSEDWVGMKYNGHLFTASKSIALSE